MCFLMLESVDIHTSICIDKAKQSASPLLINIRLDLALNSTKWGLVYTEGSTIQRPIIQSKKTRKIALSSFPTQARWVSFEAPWIEHKFIYFHCETFFCGYSIHHEIEMVLPHNIKWESKPKKPQKLLTFIEHLNLEISDESTWEINVGCSNFEDYL